MIGIPFIYDVIKAVLSNSKVIQGRVHIVPFNGQELNNSNITAAIQDLPAQQKYPVALILPPNATSSYQIAQQPYEVYDVTMLFLTKAHVTGKSQISRPAANLQSEHTIPQTWHDMKRVASDFLKVMQQVIHVNQYDSDINIDEGKQVIKPITEMGNEKVTGVMLTNFRITVSAGCNIEDYEEDYLTSIVLPDITDTHPLHTNV
ncbi:MAG: hypothetical protein EBX40_00615 [Gammaproteobacteria bacterium]|nr:hypothetical protein [Gammaproteobacteria bacterium]